ncbi:MAG: hypothetical protein ACYDEV_02605 [Acidiferrobacter sp.]
MTRNDASIENEGQDQTEGWDGKVVLLLALAWATVALGGYYIAIRMVI